MTTKKKVSKKKASKKVAKKKVAKKVAKKAKKKTAKKSSAKKPSSIIKKTKTSTLSPSLPVAETYEAEVVSESEETNFDSETGEVLA